MMEIHLIHTDGRVESGVSLLAAMHVPQDCTVWVDIEGVGEEELGMMRTQWCFHPLAIEDCVNRQLRAKYERYPTHDFLVLLALDHRTDEDLDTLPICLLMRQRLVVSVRQAPVVAVDSVKQRMDAEHHTLAYSQDRLVHAFLDAVMDEFMPLLDRYEEWLDDLERRLGADTSPKMMTDLISIRRELLHLRRILTPFHELIRRYSDREGGMSPECQLLFRDVQDHILVLQDLVSVRLEICSGAIQTHNNATTEQLNKTMKYLAVASTLGLPMTIISGVFGMNFEVIPITHHALGFYIAVGMMIVTSALLIGLFRYRRWI